MNVIFSLADRVYHFYPIGLRANRSDYPGRIEYGNILNKKIDAIINNEATTWSEFIASIKDSPYVIKDLAYEQFPSYRVDFETEQSESENISSMKKISFVVSLLTNGYTFFMEECYNYRSKSISRILRVNDLTEEEKKFADSIRDKIHHYFPAHTYINHKILLDVTIEGGILHNEDDRFPFEALTLYQYLFEPYSTYTNMTTVLD